jgi:hypothetical protein
MSYAWLAIAARTGWSIAFAMLMIVMSAAASGAETHRVVVRVYETSIGDRLTRTAAIRTASSIVELAGISVEWHDCTENGRRPACQDTRRTGNFIARIMPTLAPGTLSRKPSIAALDMQGEEPSLGFAVVDPETRAGEMATLFRDQIDTVARRTGVAGSELLGRALAHEVGHLLLGVRGHSRTGIMRAVWTADELARDRPEDWLFARTDVERLQQSLIEP